MQTKDAQIIADNHPIDAVPQWLMPLRHLGSIT
jgi:hypothetical protein